MPDPVPPPTAALNTDRELWRRTPDDYYAPSIHVTADGKIGINVGGLVRVRSVEDWHAAEAERDALAARVAEAEETASVAHKDANEWRGQAEAANARVRLLEGALRGLEWSRPGSRLGGTCPVCWRYPDAGHDPACALLAALAPPPGPEDA